MRRCIYRTHVCCSLSLWKKVSNVEEEQTAPVISFLGL
jgi:hypothetical protein